MIGARKLYVNEALDTSRVALLGATGPSWLVRWALSRGMQVPGEPREESWAADVAR